MKKFTLHNDKAAIWLNKAHILAVVPNKKEGGCVIFMSNRASYHVLQSDGQVMEALK